MAIPDGHKANFETLQRAHDNGDLALVECLDRSTGRKAAVICCIEWDGDEVEMKPVAVMCAGDQYERYASPLEFESDDYEW